MNNIEALTNMLVLIQRIMSLHSTYIFEFYLTAAASNSECNFFDDFETK